MKEGAFNTNKKDVVAELASAVSVPWQEIMMPTMMMEQFGVIRMAACP